MSYSECTMCIVSNIIGLYNPSKSYMHALQVIRIMHLCDAF